MQIVLPTVPPKIFLDPVAADRTPALLRTSRGGCGIGCFMHTSTDIMLQLQCWCPPELEARARSARRAKKWLKQVYFAQLSPFVDALKFSVSGNPVFRLSYTAAGGAAVLGGVGSRMLLLGRRGEPERERAARRWFRRGSGELGRGRKCPHWPKNRARSS